MTFRHIEFAAVVEVARKGRDRLPASMRRVVVAVDCSVNNPALPMKAVPLSQFQRKPKIGKTAVNKEYPQLIGVRDNRFGHNLRELYLGDLT
ncbi:MAG: hypothetical protein HYZ50_02495 [Deltaproteobacteria bacterium]|nr:hypothetical protein [Deltaproteobacteria bacterium]